MNHFATPEFWFHDRRLPPETRELADRRFAMLQADPRRGLIRWSEGSAMQFHAPRVSASAAGDYYQLSLGPEESDEEESDSYEVKGPYLVVQRQFEMPDRGRCYLETHDEGYIGHFPLRLTQLSRTRLAFEIVRKTDNHVEVSFVLNASEFEEVRRIAEVIFGLRDPDLGDDENAL